jgi:hypothetical protein
MRARTSLPIAALIAAATLGFGPGAGAATPTVAVQREIPQSLAAEHAETLERLSVLSRRPGEVGRVAREALVLYRQHFARERDYILPPLTLLPVLADGKVAADMTWAVAMADRVKADREVIFGEHTAMTDIANRLVTAGRRAHDQEAVEFATAAVTDSLNDIELLEPAVMMIGDYLRARLPAAQ